MDEITISAMFAAYTWFTETAAGKNASQQAAIRFANNNWQHFLEHANPGFGRLLLRVANRRTKSGHRRQGAASR